MDTIVKIISDPLILILAAVIILSYLGEHCLKNKIRK
jgi:hypothetical protein